MADRSWEGGLHQLIEAKEEVGLSGTRKTMARITYQRFFRRYLRLIGISGPVREPAHELWEDYGLRVKLGHRSRQKRREDRGPGLYLDANAKLGAAEGGGEAVGVGGGRGQV